jgi:glycosyltransferase involved in cell wall biosynthesis
MRILVISDLFLPFPGGAERYMFNLIQELTKRGHDISVLTSYQPALKLLSNQGGELNYKLDWRDIGVYERHEMGRRVIDTFIQETKPDLIITHHFFSGEFPEIFEYPIPVLELIHSRPRTPKAALAIFNSNYTANAPGQLRLPQDMIILPPVGENVVAKYHEDWIGHIKPIGGKGIMMTYALARWFPKRRFLILRGEWQGAETMISGLDNIEYMQPVNDIRKFYSRCRIMLMPSEREEAGTIPQEAAVNGMVCISSDVMGLPETNRGGIILPINLLPYNENAPFHPDNESVARWAEEINKLDDLDYYNSVVEREQNFVKSIPWPQLFDELDSKIRALVH